MAKANRSNQAANTPDAALATLLDVDSSLATQEATLRSQLEAVQEKRKSLESVIGIFSSTTAATTAATVKSAPSPSVSASSKNSKTAPAKSAKQSTAQTKSTKSTKSPAAKTAKSTPKSEKSTKSTRFSQSKADQNWQRYVRQKFEETSLPEAVSNVLQSKPNGILGIPDIVDTIFLDQMPKEVRNKASNRISNILSTGLKENKWYRGKTGHYSVSSKVAMADLAS